MIEFEIAGMADYDFLKSSDHHISDWLLVSKITNGEILLAKKDDRVVGWLRFNYFWDNIPFMNLLMVSETFRNQGIGKGLVGTWESNMAKKGFSQVMTSTLSDEGAQHFYRQLGYRDSGSLILEGEALEILFVKNLR